MSLSPGTPFGPYEIVSHLGSDGMGDGYLAHAIVLGSRDDRRSYRPLLTTQGPANLTRQDSTEPAVTLSMPGSWCMTCLR